jgi:tetratricopeptide (TPR) repeat protein
MLFSFPTRRGAPQRHDVARSAKAIPLSLSLSPLHTACLLALCLAAGLSSCGSGRSASGSAPAETGPDGKPDKSGKGKIDQAQLELDYIEGVRARQLGDPALAVARFQDVLRQDPNNGAAYFELARLHFEAGDVSRAIGLAQRASALEPENTFFLELFADMLTLTNQYEKAAEAFSRLVALQPDNPETFFQWAYTLQQSGSYRKALEAYTEVETRFGPEATLLMEKFRIHMKLNEPAQAAAELEKLVELYPDDPQHYELLAKTYESANMPDEAAAVYEKLLELEGGNPGLLLQAARIYRSRGNHALYREKALEAFSSEQIIVDAKVGFLLPWIDSLGTDFPSRELVFELLDRMVATHPDDPKAHALNGDFHFHDKQLEVARASYLRSLALQQNIFDVWRQVFAIDLELNQHDSLQAITSRASELFPNQAASFYFNGYANIRLSRYEAAVRSLRQALPMTVATPPLRAEIYSLLGDAYHHLKDDPSSDESYEKSLEIEPDNPYVLNNYSYYLSLRGENLERAEEMAARANELAPGNASFEDTYAWVLYQRGRFDEALIWQRKALASGGEDSPVQQEHYGDILFRLGKVEEAVQAWMRARELGSESELLDQKIRDRQLYD